MIIVRTALGNNAGNAAFGVAKLRVESRRLNFESITSNAFAVAVLGAPSIKRSLRIPRDPPMAKLAMCVGSKGRSNRVLPV